jgi:hypothetical protein
MSSKLVVLLCALILPVVAQTTYIPPVTAGTNTENGGVQLHVARNGNEVIVTWVLVPDMDIKQLEIYRNTVKETKGRGRAGAVRATPSIFLDQVPDISVTYWYWLKITLNSGQEINIGPLPTPDATVWTP